MAKPKKTEVESKWIAVPYRALAAFVASVADSWASGHDRPEEGGQGHLVVNPNQGFAAYIRDGESAGFAGPLVDQRIETRVETDSKGMPQQVTLITADAEGNFQALLAAYRLNKSGKLQRIR